MKTKTILLCLAAATALPSTAWSQDRPEGARPLLRGEPRQLQPEGRSLMQRDAPPREVAPGWRIGVLVDPAPPLLRSHLGLKDDTGVVVDRVMDQSPAAKAGLKPGDIIAAANGEPVGNIDALRKAVGASAESGKPLMLHVFQKGKKKQIRIAPPEKDKAPAKPEMAERPRRERDVPPGVERMGQALREMRAELDKQREAIRRLEKRLEDMSHDH